MMAGKPFTMVTDRKWENKPRVCFAGPQWWILQLLSQQRRGEINATMHKVHMTERAKCFYSNSYLYIKASVLASQVPLTQSFKGLKQHKQQQSGFRETTALGLKVTIRGMNAVVSMTAQLRIH